MLGCKLVAERFESAAVGHGAVEDPDHFCRFQLLQRITYAYECIFGLVYTLVGAVYGRYIAVAAVKPFKNIASRKECFKQYEHVETVQPYRFTAQLRAGKLAAFCGFEYQPLPRTFLAAPVAAVYSGDNDCLRAPAMTWAENRAIAGNAYRVTPRVGCPAVWGWQKLVVAGVLAAISIGQVGIRRGHT